MVPGNSTTEVRYRSLDFCSGTNHVIYLWEEDSSNISRFDELREEVLKVVHSYGHMRGYGNVEGAVAVAEETAKCLGMDVDIALMPTFPPEYKIVATPRDLYLMREFLGKMEGLEKCVENADSNQLFDMARGVIIGSFP